MPISGDERERLSRRVTDLRKKCGITQEQAARLLGIAKNTWVRWEAGKFRPDELMLELLPYLARNECPSPCSASRATGLDEARMAEHIRTCRICWLAINYLATVTKGSRQPSKSF